MIVLNVLCVIDVLIVKFVIHVTIALIVKIVIIVSVVLITSYKVLDLDIIFLINKLMTNNIHILENFTSDEFNQRLNEVLGIGAYNFLK